MTDLRQAWAAIRAAKVDRDRISARQGELAAQVEELARLNSALMVRVSKIEAVPAVRNHL